LRLLALNLHLKTVHKFFSIKNTLHLRRIALAQCATATFSSVRSGDVLSITKHEVQFSRFKLVPLSIPCSDSLEIFKVSLQAIYLSFLCFNETRLLFYLSL
jgi:hypothetical protein